MFLCCGLLKLAEVARKTNRVLEVRRIPRLFLVELSVFVFVFVFVYLIAFVSKFRDYSRPMLFLCAENSGQRQSAAYTRLSDSLTTQPGNAARSP